jgi:hypothetical protein
LVRSEIYQLERFIADFLSREQLRLAKKVLPGDAVFSQALTTLCAEIKKKWVQNLFSAVKDAVLARYVHYHQAGITGLANQVSQAAALNPAAASLYAEIQLQLDELIDYLREKFYAYFDEDHPVSSGRWLQRSAELKALLDRIEIALQQADIANTLVDIMVLAFSVKLMEGTHIPVSFRQLNNYFSILRALDQRLSAEATPTTQEIALELYRHNFNSSHFKQWYQDRLTATLNKLPANQVSDQLRQEIRLLEAVHTDSNKLFENDLPPINEMLLGWLYARLPQNEGPATTLINGHEHMPLQFSVAQFALFIRLCYLEGCFQVNNISAILRFFSGHFETKKQLHISVKSFARAFYGADQATAAVVRGFLQRMINQINKTYFP